MNSDPDDLLSFKEFPETRVNLEDNSQPAQISINSPVRSNPSASSSNATSELFQNIVNDMTNSVPFLNEEDSRTHQGNEFNDPNEPSSSSDKQMYSFWTLEYYQQYFNVDTLMVIDRIANSIIPKRAPPNYLTHIGTNPDLYGPFWITVTLVFSIAISGNIASYLHHASDDYKWQYDFHLVSYAATAIFIYVFIVPLLLWGIFKWSLKPVEEDLETESSGYTPSILSIICIYGYSLFIYIPVSILWVIQISYLQWLLVITAALLSGSVLIFVLSPALRNSNLSLFLMIGIVAVHFLLAAGFMEYFFHSPPDIETPTTTKILHEIIATTKAAAPITKQIVPSTKHP